MKFSITKKKTAVWVCVIFLAVIGVAAATRRIVNLTPTLVHGCCPAPVSANPRLAQVAVLDDLFAHYPLLTLIHIVPGLFFMILGPLQFSVKIRANHLWWHRLNGRILVACGLVIGISALIMSLRMPAIGGVTQATATTLFGTYFLFALATALWHIRHRDIALHREWMIRAFAIGLAVATIRPIIGLFFATSPLTGLTPHDFFGIAFWVGFVLHAVVAEIWIRSTRPETISRRMQPETQGMSQTN